MFRTSGTLLLACTASFVIAVLFVTLPAQAKQLSEESIYLPLIASADPSLTGRVVMVEYNSGDYEIATVNPNGSDRVRVTDTDNGVINITPSWSWDRSKIAFARHNNVTGRERGIYVINADGSGETRLTNSDTRGYDFGPVFSPDGSKIAYYTTNNSIEQIIIMNSDGSDPIGVTDGRFAAAAPDWSPDGSKIVYASRQNVEENGRYEIFVMNADGSNQTRLTVNPNADDGAPSWSPDGSKIAFYSLRNSESHIYIMNADGSSQTAVPNTSAVAPTWSPDGTKLMFVAQPDSTSNLELYTVHLDGSSLRRMTTTTSLLEDSPHWRP